MEPLVTIKLSEYNDLVKRAEYIARQDLLVGRRYEITEDKNTDTFHCQSYSDGFYHMVATPPLKPTRYIKISLKQQQ